MNVGEFLPAVLLPNSDNAQDTTAVFQNGEKTTVANLLSKFEVSSDLRFMIKASEPKTSEEPRITWNAQGDGTILAAAAFVSGTDTHGRIVSAAIVFKLAESTEFLSKIPPGLPVELQQNVHVALEALNSDLREYVKHQRQLGKIGGEYKPEKKKPIPPYGGSHRYSY